MTEPWNFTEAQRMQFRKAHAEAKRQQMTADLPAEISLVCASCGKPVERCFDDDFQHESVDDALACTAWPVRPARAGAEAAQ